MNFLSHFYFDRQTADPNRVLGTVLPDLIRNAKKEWLVRPEKHPDDFKATKNMASLFCGWKRHLEIDRQFHSSDFFSTHTRQIRSIISTVLENSPVRPSFLAHISLELMLDSLLITEDIIDPDTFYNQLKLADRKTIKQFLSLNRINDHQHFFRFFDNFLEAGYLHSYRETTDIMYALNRICMRIWPQSMNETQKLQLTAVMLDYREELQSVFMDIFNEIDNRL